MSKPTAGTLWRAPRVEGYLKQLPSGNWARLRPVSPDQIIASGDVPDILTPLVVKMLYRGTDGSELTQLVTSADESLKHAAATVKLVNAVCRGAFVSPRIVAEPAADDEISIDDVTILDRYYVYQLASQPAEVLRSFMFQPPPDVAAVPDGTGDGEQTERPDDDTGPVGGAPV